MKCRLCKWEGNLLVERCTNPWCSTNLEALEKKVSPGDPRGEEGAS